MAKTIDISGKLTNERPVLKLGEGKEYPIDNRKNTVLAIQSKIDGEAEALDEVLELALGKDAVKEINESDITFEDYQTIFVATIAGALGEDYEVVSARFQQAKQQA
jgi:hypothetical protein